MIRHFPYYRQQDTADCGWTCLRMVAGYYGKTISASDADPADAKTSITLLRLSDLCEKYGFDVHCARVSMNDLISRCPLPAILHWSEFHFVVLVKIIRNRFFLADPASGASVVDSKEFERKWLTRSGQSDERAGIALLLQPTPSF